MPVITFSGTLGSGAREIAQLVAQRLGLDYVDREILARTAQSLGVSVAAVEQRDERPVTLGERVASMLSNFLERSVLRYTPEEVARSYGRRSHDYGWKVKGRAKSGRTLEQLLGGYLNAGWELEEASSSYFAAAGPSAIEAISKEPFISEEKAARRRISLEKSRTKAASSREEKRRTCDGPGFYVTNGYVGGIRSRVADHPKPFGTYDEAEEFAVRRLRHLLEFSFDYLLPVAVIESSSRDDADRSVGHVWWVDGKFRGPEVDPRQRSFGFWR